MKYRGITLIALVITIILMLILVGVTMTVLTSDFTVITTKATYAKEKTRARSVKTVRDGWLLEIKISEGTRNRC